MDLSWVQVEPGDQLMVTIYRFRPNNTPITLSKISLRQMRSVTTNASRPQATAFHNALDACESACIISQQTHHLMLTGSHLAPKHLGDAGIQSIIQHFTDLHGVPVNRYAPIIGILLFTALDKFVDFYQVGFWACGPVSPL